MEKYLQKLVSFKTVDGNKSEFDACLNWLEEFFSDRFLITHRLDSNGYQSLIATTKATKKPKVLLQAHLDVVPGHDDMFSLKKDGDKVIGRGVFDMKFAIAVFMQVVDELQNNLSNYDFGIMITTDEEIGGLDGVKHLLDEGWGAEVCILPDGGDNWRLEESSKGFWLIEATAHGKAAHGSRPWEGENAVGKLIEFLREAEAIFKDQSTTTPTLTIASIHGGEALNQVPELAVAELDIRTTEANNHHDIMSSLESSAKKHDVTLVKKFSGQPLLTDVNTKYAKSFLNHIANLTGGEAELTQSLGSSDARFFAEKGIQSLVMRPNGGDAHADDEWLKLSDLAIYKQLVVNFLNEHCI